MIVVTGMHRSGTSLAAALLEATGVDLGNPETMLPPQPDNPRGFWEQLEVVEANEHVLQLLGGPWSDPPELADGWWLDPILEDAVGRAQAAIDAAFEGRPDGRRAIKDPRFCLTLPLWRPILDVEHVVHVVREPAAVVASLGSRAAIAPDRAGALWLRHVASLRRVAPDAVVVRHDDLLREPVTTVAAMLDRLDAPPPDQPDVDRMLELVDPGLWRARTTDPQSPVVEIAQQVFARLGEADAVLDLVDELTAAAAARLAGLRAEAADATRAAADDRAHRASAEAERDHILASTSWKLGSRLTGLLRRS